MLKSVEARPHLSLPSEDPPDRSGFFDFPHVARLIWRNRTLIGACVLACGALGLAVAKLTPPTYTATAQILIDPRRLDLFQKDAVFTGAPVDVGTMESQVQQVASERIATEVMRKMGLADDPEFNGAVPSSPLDVALDALRLRGGAEADPEARAAATLEGMMKRLSARRVGLSYVIEAQFVSTNPVKAAAVVNAVADAYIDDGIAGRISAMQRAGSWLEERLDELGKRAMGSEQALNAFRADPQNLGPAEMYAKVKELESSATTYRSLYDNFLQRYMQVVQQQTFPAVEGRVAARASPPTEKSGPKTLLYVAAALTFGALLGGSLALAREISDGTVRTQRQAASAVGAPSLGLLPRLVDDPGRQAIPLSQARGLEQRLFATTGALNAVEDDRFSAYAETIRAIKIAADGPQGVVRTRVIGVCSVLPDEGAAAVAVNLALLAAGAGARTLLVDADMRRPALSARLTPQARVGFAEAANDPLLLPTAVWRHAKLASLGFLPAAARNAATDSFRVLSGAGAQDFVSRSLVEYDYVILSLASLRPLVDVRAALPLVEGVVLVAKWGATPLALMEAQAAEVDGLRDKLLGVALSNVDPSAIGAYEPESAGAGPAGYAPA